jgi:hypothetical protein
MMQIGQWMDGIFFFFLSLLSLCYPFSAHPCSLYPYILSYHNIHTRNTIRKSTHLLYLLYISRQSLVNGFSRKDNKLRIR